MLEDYLYEYCNFGCAYFVIQRVGGKKERVRRRRKETSSSKQSTSSTSMRKQEVVSQNRSQRLKSKPKEKARSTKRKNK